MLEPHYIYVFVIGIALLWDTLIPDIAWIWTKIPHPVTILGKIITLTERTLYTPAKIIGGLGSLIVILIWGGLGFLIEYSIFSYTNYGTLISVILVSITLASNAMTYAVKRIMIAIDRNHMAQARILTKHICSRDTSTMNMSDCGRTAMESMAENLSDGVIAPAIYYAVFGLGGLFIYKAINTMDSMWGYPSKKYKNFGWAAARLDDMANFIPARLTALLIIIATITYGKTRTQSALVCVKKYAHTHNSPNAGYPESAFAGGLHIAFGGKRHYPEIGEINHWIGDNTQPITPKIMMAGIGLFKRTIYVSVALLAVILTYALPTI